MGTTIDADYLQLGTSTREASAKFQVDSTDSGFLGPRMTTVQRVAISSPALGLEVFDTDLSLKYIYTGSWAPIGAGGDVSKVGTPVDNQIGVWTGDGTLEGDASLTFDGTTLAITGDITLSGTVDGIDIATDVAANTSKITNANHSGDVTGSGALTIANDAVTYAKMQNVVADDRILGNVAGTGQPVAELTATQIRSMINVADGATAVTVDDTAYNATSWNANTDAATKNAIRDQVETMDTAIGFNTTHRTSDGSDHSYIDQAVTIASSPTFAGATLSGSLAFTGGYSITTASHQDFSIITAGTGVVKIGSGSPSYLTPTAGELFVEGGAEFNYRVDITGPLWARGSVAALPDGSGRMLYLGNPLGYYGILHRGANDGLRWAINPNSSYQNRHIIFTDSVNYLKDHGHSTTSPNSKLFIHSVTDPYSDNTQWGGLTHLTTAFEISSGGTTNIDLVPGGGDVNVTGNITVTGTVDGIDLATDVAANTAKVTNATHTGDVTGDAALTIAAGAVDIAMLSATGTPSAATYLRGDNTWATPAGGGDVVDDTSPQLGGSLDLNDHYITLKASPTADHTGSGARSQVTVDVNATGIGAVLFCAADGNYEEADADAATSMPGLVLALESGTGSKYVLHWGYFRDDSWAWTPGDRLFVSNTAGALTATAPSGSVDVSQPVAVATHADRIFFWPALSMTVIT